MLTDLGTTPIAETLRALAGSRSSGDLQVQSGKTVKTLFFDHGRIVFAASNLKKDRLGEALVALGRITDEQFSQASKLLGGERKRRFGEALIHSGIMDKTELGRSVARQVNRIVLSVFPFSEGVATFDERTSAIPLEYMVSLSMHRILYDGIKTMTSEVLVQTGLGHLDRKVQLAPVAPFAFQPGDASPDELEILEHAQRKVSLRRLAWVPGASPSSACAPPTPCSLPACSWTPSTRRRACSPASRWRRARSCSPPCSASPIRARRKRCAAKWRTSWSGPRSSTARPG